MPPPEGSSFGQPYSAPPPGEGLYCGQEGLGAQGYGQGYSQGYGQPGYGGQGEYAGNGGRRREGEGLVERLEEDVRREL